MKPIILCIVTVMFSASSFGQIIKLVKDIVPGNDGSYPQVFCTLNNGKVLLSAGNGFFDRSLYISDGVDDGSGTYIFSTKALSANISLGVKYVFRNNKLFLPMCTATECDLWVSDGTDSGTHVVKDIHPGEFDVWSEAELMPYNNRVCFVAEDNKLNKGIWITDGTENGTYMLKTIDPNLPLQTVFAHTEAFGKLYFGTDTLWCTDGTPQGTIPVQGASFSWPYYIQELAYYKRNNQLYVRVSDGTNSKLYSYDPINGMQLLNFTGGGFFEVNGKLFFYNSDALNGFELWVTDSTGTMLVKDINPGLADSNPIMQGELNGKLLFTAENPTLGRELWVSDGTSMGTTNVIDLNQGSGDGMKYAGGFGTHTDKGKFYFAGYDGTNTDLWVTDGTLQGTDTITFNNPNQRFDRDISSIHAQNNRVWLGYEYGGGVNVELCLYGAPVVGGITAVENKNASVFIYPNPCNGSFTIHVDSLQGKHRTVQVMDIMGKVIYSRELASGKNKYYVDLSSSPTGLYNVIIRTNNEIITYRVSVQKS